MKHVQKICINCPAGCHLDITADDTGKICVTGNACPRGEKYAVQEMTDPRRVVTAVVRSEGPQSVCIPVRSSAPVPKAMIPGLLKTLFAMREKLPVKQGQVLLKNVHGTGIDVLATRSFE